MTADKPNNALEIIFARNAFYRRMYFLALSALCLAIIAIGILGWMFIYLYRHPTKPLYFATDEVSRLITIIPVDRPNMTREKVEEWTIEALQRSFSYDFVNFRRQFQNAQKYFTNYGWNNYMSAIAANNMIPTITQRKMVVIGQVAGKPALVTEGILGGAYAYRFNLNMLLTYLLPPYDNQQINYTNPVVVSVIVQRQPILQSYQGLGIVQVVASIPTQPTPTQSPVPSVVS